MTTTERAPLPLDAAPYLAAVRSRLWSLTPVEREELLEDLAAHLTELAAEDGPSLRERLGAPSVYAEDFVASAGVEPRTAPGGARDRWRLPPAVRQRFADLRPTWLVLRPFLVVFGAAALLNDQLFGEVGPVEIVALAVIGLALVGVSQRVDGAWDKVATGAGIVAAFVVVGALSDGRVYIYVDNGASYGPPGVLTHGDGEPIANIWAYDVEGNPVDVFLFDQNGRPIDDVSSDGFDPRTGAPLWTEPRTAANGAPVPNLYPRRQVREDVEGRHFEREDGPPSVVTPSVSSTTTTTVAPTTTSSTVPPPG